ncbi:hypothetical protein LOTGIDRAFT_232270 [Lottia gigantea]|uniref:EF-hand domain-containing protein n=1 Tax=Lottia gigantea TaxID=225164 RepID=V4AJH2_LOTGI|nr:hypothetical protein LOTGIDRAFT_232270 [Lottia gigantea]ESO94840.1 hypothetical protein LOTGIDRAFT_232270 [Lottia gigantea]
MKTLAIFFVAMIMLMLSQAFNSALESSDILKREGQHTVKKRQASLLAQLYAAGLDGAITPDELVLILGLNDIELNPVMLAADLNGNQFKFISLFLIDQFKGKADGVINNEWEYYLLLVALDIGGSGMIDDK